VEASVLAESVERDRKAICWGAKPKTAGARRTVAAASFMVLIVIRKSIITSLEYDANDVDGCSTLSSRTRMLDAISAVIC
jgi:hypothetical protein